VLQILLAEDNEGHVMGALITELVQKTAAYAFKSLA
jgi:hypothetical protein